jgi:UDP-N-acetylglucosamine 2-epimerase (non-hydrolysing)
MPEEINRIITDSISDFHFITSREALVNLQNEGINNENCYFTGNTMIDSLVKFNEKFDNSSILKRLNLVEKEYALITLHRPSNVDKKAEIKRLMDALVKVTEIIQCVFVIHPRTKNNLCKFGLFARYNKIESLQIIEPLGYIDFMSLQKNSKLVITDSGGVQEESSFLNIPCLTIRENTERPITIIKGTNTLVGSNYEDIYQYIRNINYSINSDIELWDGKSSERIVDIIDELIKSD